MSAAPRMRSLELERVLYWRGQALLARDFLDEAAQADERRFWHTRAVHAAYGVAEGLAVHIDSVIRVNRGVAFDRFGRELVLPRARVAPAPPVASVEADFDLVLRLREGSCDSGSFLVSRVDLAWVPSSMRRRPEDVPLARFRVSADGIFEHVAAFAPPRARAQSRPRLAGGITLPGHTPWREGTYSSSHQWGVSIETRVDTSAAGFTEVPCYLAWFEGPLFDPDAGELVWGAFTRVTGETLTGFTFGFWIPSEGALLGVESSGPEMLSGAGIREINVIRTFAGFEVYARRHRLAVSWLGGQEMGHAPPSDSLLEDW
jgi:hypothetical protein